MFRNGLEQLARPTSTMFHTVKPLQKLSAPCHITYRHIMERVMPWSTNHHIQKSAEDYLDDFLKERREEIEANPSLRITDRLTQRGAWYRVRPIMVADGFEPKKNWGITDETFAGNIRKHCKQLWPDELRG